MKVLNLHGFDGNSQNTNCSILTKCGVELIISPQLNYREHSLQEIYNQLIPIVIDEGIDFIIATSFGAFFGKRLSNDFNLPCIFTNPCLRPDISLKDIAPEYCTDDRLAEMAKWIADQKSYNFRRDVIIVGDQDEVIDHSTITLFTACGATFYHIEDGQHSLYKDQYEQVFKEVINHAKVA